jgi:hypothetical protein
MIKYQHEDPWRFFAQKQQELAEYALQNYLLSGVSVRIENRPELYSEFEVRVQGKCRAGLEWRASCMCSGDELRSGEPLELLIAELIRGVRRFEEDRELNLTP